MVVVVHGHVLLERRLFAQTRQAPPEDPDGRPVAVLAVRLLQDGRVGDGGDGLRPTTHVRCVGRVESDGRLPQRQPGEAERVAVPASRLRDEAVSPVLGRDGVAPEVAGLRRRARTRRLAVDVLHLRLRFVRRLRRAADGVAPSTPEHARDGRRQEAYAIAVVVRWHARLRAMGQGQCLDADDCRHVTSTATHSRRDH